VGLSHGHGYTWHASSDTEEGVIRRTCLVLLVVMSVCVGGVPSRISACGLTVPLRSRGAD